jgi:hypothetical protein
MALGVKTTAPLAAVLVVGLVARAILLPITHGPDFVVWDLASRATLNGVNVYEHHPPYTGGPYPYFPLFLYLEVPMQWLTVHIGVPFTVMGKLPIVGADLLATLVIVKELRRRGRGPGAEALAASLFFLNPLVLYNGAFYGRFDSVCIALFLVALSAFRPRRPATWGFALVYALAVAAKTFPIFVLPWLLVRDRMTAVRVLIALCGVLFALSAPYLLTSPHAFVTDLLYSADKLSGGLSWQVIFHRLPTGEQLVIGDALLGGFLVASIALAFVDDLTICAVATMLLFMVFSKQVIEQYLTWPLPLLALLVVDSRSRTALFLLATLTISGMVVNAYFHPFGIQPAAINVPLAGLVCAGVGRLLWTSRFGWPRQAATATSPAEAPEASARA